MPAPPLLLPPGRATSSAFSWNRFWRALLRRVTGLAVEVFSVRLAAGQELQLREVAGWTVVCRSGAVWITQETDTRDIFLERGEGFALDRGGLTLVCACKNSVLSIRAPAGPELVSRPQRGTRDVEMHSGPAGEPAQPAWLRSLYPEYGPWNDPASYRRAGLL